MVTRQATLDEGAVNGQPRNAVDAGPRAVSPSRLRASKALFLAAAGVSFLLSVSLWFLGSKEQGLFVGLWVPSILSLGGLLLSNPGGAR